MTTVLAFKDITAGIRRWPDWLSLAWFDFVLPHRRAIVGPLWEMLYVAVWVAGLSIVFMASERGTTVSYVAYVACGVTFFGFISSVLTSSPSLFRRRANLIQNISLPMAFYVYRLIATSAIKLLFQLLVVLATVMIFVGGFKFEALWAFPAFLLYLATAAWTALLLAIVGTRFGDTQFATTALMRFLFFASPVFWVPVEGTMRETLAAYNPLTYYIEIMRAPLLGQAPSLTAWGIVIAISAMGSIVTFLVFARLRRLIPFWL